MYNVKFYSCKICKMCNFSRLNLLILVQISHRQVKFSSFYLKSTVCFIFNQRFFGNIGQYLNIHMQYFLQLISLLLLYAIIKLSVHKTIIITIMIIYCINDTIDL